MNIEASEKTGWIEEDGSRYWYENGIKQGTEGRGKEIYDSDSDEWYWLDACDGGKMAVSKDTTIFLDGNYVYVDKDGHIQIEVETTYYITQYADTTCI